MRVRSPLLVGPCAGLLLLGVAGCATSTLASSGAPGGWSIQSTPNPTAYDPTSGHRYPGGDLVGVSCPSAHVCVAVGNNVFSTGALAERWDGSRWSIQRTPNPRPGGLLLGVSCPSVRDCIAVGGSYPTVDMGLGNARRIGRDTLAERWEGHRWTIQRTPNRPGGNTLKAVSCVSASFCMAVGEVSKPYPSEELATLAEHWNGSRWSIQRTPSPSDHPYPGSETRPGSVLDGVSCSSIRDCMAVGERTDGKLIAEHWNGRRWSLQPIPSPAGLNQISGVACRPAFCIAVAASQLAPQLLIERWDGTRWSMHHAPSPAGGGALLAVSCPSSHACTAVGLKAGAKKHTVTTLAERWNGTRWSIQSTFTGATDPKLVAVSCSSTRACTAVGTEYRKHQGNTTLAERWTG